LITIIDLGISNIKSITRGFTTQGFEVKIAKNPLDVKAAKSLVLPGVGAFPKAVEILKVKKVWNAIIDYANSGRPLIGICLGMQLLFTSSEEHGYTEGLNLIKGRVVKFPDDRRVPHMGWNEVMQKRMNGVFNNGLFNHIPDSVSFYFVHSYYAVCDNDEDEIGYTDHGGRFISAVQRRNIYGTQFHPEKSQKYGLMLLKNFALITESSIN